MTLKNAVTKGVKAWRGRRVGYWLCIDPKTGEYYLLTSANLAELNGLKAMYRLPAVYYRAVLTRDWNVKLGPHVIGNHLDTSAYIEDLDGFFDRIEAKNKVELRKAFEEAKQQAIERSEWVLCHGAHYYTARTPDGRDIIGKGENGVFVGGVFWHGTKRPNFRFRGRRGSLRSRIRILPPRDPPGDGGRREGGGKVFTVTQLYSL